MLSSCAGDTKLAPSRMETTLGASESCFARFDRQIGYLRHPKRKVIIVHRVAPVGRLSDRGHFQAVWSSNDLSRR
jgi:hypothetical protein